MLFKALCLAVKKIEKWGSLLSGFFLQLFAIFGIQVIPLISIQRVFFKFIETVLGG